MSTSSLLVNCEEKGARKKHKKPEKKVVIKAKGALERIFGSKQNVKDHYFSEGVNITKENMRDVLTEPSPFKYPADLDEFAYKIMSKVWDINERAREFTLDYTDRNNYVSRGQRDTLNRLYVEAKNIKSAKTILDIDSDFYSIVEGRPIEEKFSITNYVENLREVMRIKIVTGYRMDDALLIEENLLEEQNMIDDITKQYLLYVTTFEEYLSNDHSISMELLRACECEANKAFEKYEVYRELAKEYGSLKSQVSNLEEKWRNCKVYQKFLYLVSPMHWRKQHDFYHMVIKDNDSVEIRDESNIMESADATGDNKSMDEIIEFFLDDCKITREPLLYFKNPRELIKVFRFIELQNLNSLLHSEELAVPLESLKEAMIQTEATFNAQINDLQEIIDNLEGEILWQEERAATLEALARELINGEFKKLLCDETTLSLHVMVEDVYEARVAPNDANLTTYDMMKAIEVKYRELLLKLDYLPYEKVYKAENECYSEQKKIMKVAMDAARKVIQIERLVKRLRSILEPPKEQHTRELKRRSLLCRPKNVVVHVEQPISPEEAEYLYLFTDFCEEVDNIKEYRDVRKQELYYEAKALREHEQQENEKK